MFWFQIQVTDPRMSTAEATVKERKKISDEPGEDFEEVSLHDIRPRKDERLSWPSWLTCSGRFTHSNPFYEPRGGSLIAFITGCKVCLEATRECSKVVG